MKTDTKIIETFTLSKIVITCTFVVVIAFVAIHPDTTPSVVSSDITASTSMVFANHDQQPTTESVTPRIVAIQKGQSLIEVTGMTESQAYEFAKNNGMGFDKNNNPVVHEGNRFMLLPGSVHPTDSFWVADNYHNKKVN